MGRKKPKIEYRLDSSGIKDLSVEEIRAILRAADELIATGGRSMLAKILKGSKDKRVLKHELHKCHVYGFYSHLSLPEITKRIDWMIKHGYLEIEYSGRLPVIVFSKKGWEIERETYAEELLQKLQNLLSGNDYSFVAELKDRNRGMILLLIEKIKSTNKPEFIPLLKAWQNVDYKKVRMALQDAIDALEYK
ncbi:MAG: RQC-minor-1 family DNA-binding protein [Tangfeifania sp.]